MKSQPCGYKPAITHAVFVCPEMLSHVCNAFPVVLHTHRHLSLPRHTENLCLFVHLGFVLLLNTMTQVVQEIPKRLGFAGLWGTWALAPPKSMFSRSPWKVANSSLPSAVSEVRKAAHYVSQPP